MYQQVVLPKQNYVHKPPNDTCEPYESQKHTKHCREALSAPFLGDADGRDEDEEADDSEENQLAHPHSHMAYGEPGGPDGREKEGEEEEEDLGRRLKVTLSVRRRLFGGVEAGVTLTEARIDAFAVE